MKIDSFNSKQCGHNSKQSVRFHLAAVTHSDKKHFLTMKQCQSNENSVFKKALLIFGALALSTMITVTLYNTQRLINLQEEIELLKKKVNSGLGDPQVLITNDIISRSKRNVEATDDGVTKNSKPYAEYTRHNLSRERYPGFKGLSITSMPAKPSYFGSYSSLNTISPNEKGGITKQTNNVNIRSSRIMHYEDPSKSFRQAVKVPELKTGDNIYSSNEYNTDGSAGSEIHVREVRRRNRQRMETLDETHPRTGRIKPLPSVHYSGDTSKYVFGTHDNFNGNGHLRHLQRTFVDWKVKSWVEKTGMNTHFHFEDGYLTIKEPGIYFVYAQIYYLDEHDRNGYRVYKNSETILQCTVSSHSSSRIEKGNTCYTAGVEYFAENDRISLGDLSDGRYSLFEPGKSFFGVIKLGDIRARV